MSDFANIDPKSNAAKNVRCESHNVNERIRPNHSSRRLVANAQNQVTTTFIRYCDRVFVDLFFVELVLCFLKLKTLGFARKLTLEIDLRGTYGHC